METKRIISISAWTITTTIPPIMGLGIYIWGKTIVGEVPNSDLIIIPAAGVVFVMNRILNIFLEDWF